MKKDKIELKLDDIESKMIRLIELFNGFKDNFHPEPLIKALDLAKSTFTELHQESRKNISTLNLMTNELKGVVSMSRAALDEGRKFTGLLELPKLLDAWTIQYELFINAVHKLNTKFKDMDIKNETLNF